MGERNLNGIGKIKWNTAVISRQLWNLMVFFIKHKDGLCGQSCNENFVKSIPNLQSFYSSGNLSLP